jgi:enterochelin esterase family protein
MNAGYTIFLAVLFTGSTLFAQAVPTAQAQSPNLPAGPPSPVVQPDGRVTFNLLAPGAATVSLDGDHPIGNGYRNGKNLTSMTKDEKGVWTVTVGPLKPDFYSYYFVVDGARMPDPQNVRVTRDGLRYSNWAVVPGPNTMNYEINDVPHGTVGEVWYPSPTLNMSRRALIYTPPGYDGGTDRYPVFYLIHGGGGDEHAWTDMGRAPEIFDNLIAQRRMVPMIVVMGNGNEWQAMSPNDRPMPGAYSNTTGILKFPDSVVRDLVPFVDKTYRTKADKENRAIAGLSRGGAQTLYAAMNNLDTFAWVGVFSGGLPLLPGVLINIPMPADAATRRGPDIGHSIDPEKFEMLLPTLGPDVNAKLRLFFLTIGTDDGLVESWIDARRIFDQKGVKYTWVELPGYGHEWPFWRLALQDFAGKIFQTQPN